MLGIASAAAERLRADTAAAHLRGVPVGAEVLHVVGRLDPLLAKHRRSAYDGPVVPLVNAGCFNACDLFTLALADHGRAKVVGPAPTGGGRASPLHADLFPHADNAQIRRSIYWWAGGVVGVLAVLKQVLAWQRKTAAHPAATVTLDAALSPEFPFTASPNCARGIVHAPFHGGPNS